MFDLPTIALVAIPSAPVQLRGFLDRDGAVANEVERPPSLRQYGFDLDAGGQVQLVEGMVRRSVLPDYKLLEVWRDGVVQFIARGDQDFLAWGRREQQNAGFRINPLVVAEVTLMFAIFVERVYAHAGRRPERVVYQIHLRNARNGAGELSRLVPFALGTVRWLAQQSKVAPRPDRTMQIEAATDTPPAAIAYELLREFYAWFGVDAGEIPYTAEIGGRRAVSADLIRSSRE